MKIALCISGMLRGMEICLPTWHKHLLKPEHEWHAFVVCGPNVEWCGSDSSTPILNQLSQSFKQVGISIESSMTGPFPQILHDRNFNKRPIDHVMSMFHKIKTANQLKSDYEERHGFKYDVVMRWRPDTFLKTNIEITNEDKYFVPKHGDFGGLNDQMAWSNSENMDYFSGIYDKIIPYLEADPALTFNPELLVKRHWEKSGKPLQRPNILYQLARNNSQMLPDNETRERIMRESNGTRNL